MSTRVKNSTVDNRSSSRSNVGQYTLASTSCNPSSVPRRAAYIQQPKMRSFLRLDSVGEVSPAKHSANIQVGGTSENSRPVLRSTKSADTAFAFGTNGLLPKSNMKMAKSLVRSSSTSSYGSQYSASPASNMYRKPAEIPQSDSYIRFDDGSKALDVSLKNHKNLIPLSLPPFCAAPAGIAGCNNLFAGLTRTNEGTKLWEAMDDVYKAPPISFMPSLLAAVSAACLVPPQTCISCSAPSQPCSQSNCTAPVSSQTGVSCLAPSPPCISSTASSQPCISLMPPSQTCSSSHCFVPEQARQHSAENILYMNSPSVKLATCTSVTDNEAESSAHVSSYFLNQSDRNVVLSENVGKSEKASEMTPSINEHSQLSPTICDVNERGSSEADIQKIENCFLVKEAPKCEQIALDDAPNCSSKPDVSAVLSAPRRVGKKGRPSAKKRKKRQREKRKRESCLSSLDELSSSLVAKEMKKEIFEPCCDKFCVSLSSDCDTKCDSSEGLGSNLHNSIQEQLVAENPPLKRCPVISLYLDINSDAYETEDDDDDFSDDDDDDDDWSQSESVTCAFPKGDSCFNVSLNLDSIFKRKIIPSLKSLLDVEESESETEASPSQQNSKECPPKQHGNGHGCPNLALEISKSQVISGPNLVLGTSKYQNIGDINGSFLVVGTSKSRNSGGNINGETPLTSVKHVSRGFTTGLSVDFLFSKKLDVSCETICERVESSLDSIDGLVQADIDHCLTNGRGSCHEAINVVNARWDESYPSAGFRACENITAEEITHPSIKVHFAQESDLVTVHMVGSEERAGMWHLCALDRERFLRRIQDIEQIVSPVLDAGHRARVLARSQCFRESGESVQHRNG